MFTQKTKARFVNKHKYFDFPIFSENVRLDKKFEYHVSFEQTIFTRGKTSNQYTSMMKKNIVLTRTYNQ